MSHIFELILKYLPGDAMVYIYIAIVWAIGRFMKLEWFQKILEPTAKLAGLAISNTILLLPKISAKTAENIENGFFSTLFQLISWYAGRIDFWMRSDNGTIAKSLVNKPFNIDEDKKPKYSKPVEQITRDRR